MQRYLRQKTTLAEDCNATLDERHSQISAAIEETGRNIYQRFRSMDRLYNAGMLKHQVYTNEMRQLEVFLLHPELVNTPTLAFADMLATVNKMMS